MQYQPPIAGRETEKLLDIIQTPEDWEPIALERARAELERRGISIGQQKRREKSFKNFRRRSFYIMANKSHSVMEFILLIIFSPLLILIDGGPFMLWDPTYPKKSRQSCLAFILGLAFWGLVFYLFKS